MSIDLEPPDTYGPPPYDDEVVPTKALGTILRRSELGGLPKVGSLIEDLVSSPAAVLLVGAYGLGKTALVHAFACSVATGQAFLDHEVHRRRVLMVIGEGAYGLDVRIKAWEDSWHGGVQVGDHDLTFIVKPGSLAHVNTWQQITEYAVAGQYGFIIFDTFSSLATDVDEVKDAPKIMRHLSDLSSAIGGTTLLVHHPGWGDTGRARGGSQLEADADEVLLLEGVASEPLLSLKRKKVKDGATGEKIYLRRNPAAGSIIIEHARAAEIEAPLRDRITAILAIIADTGSTGPQLMKECGVDDTGRSGFYAALSRLAKLDLIRSTGERRTKTYYLTEHAPQDAS